MANKIAIITDSTCDVPEELREKYEITVVPSIIIFGSKQYLDGVEMTADEFYQQLSHENHHPSTSHPAPAAFLKAYRDAVKRGAEQILTIVVAASMSGTITAAQQASKDIDIPVVVMDSCSNSMGLGWQLIAAARVREKGGTLTDMVAAAERVRKNIVYYVSLNTIEFLSKGGRIGDAIRLVESVLTIKPLVFVKPEDGTVGVGLPARSRKRAIEGLQREFFKNINIKFPMHITVLHNNALDEAKGIAKKIVDTYKPIEMFISIASPVLGVHTGPKALALCGYAEN